VLNLLQKGMDEGMIVKMRPEHFVVNIIALCVFPFAVRPVIREIAFKGDDHTLTQFLTERREEVKRFVLKAIQPE
jgi:hypothetical protein